MSVSNIFKVWSHGLTGLLMCSLLGLLLLQLAPDDLQERLRKKQYWDENKKTLELALKSPWAGSSGDRTGIGSTRASRGHERSIRANGRGQ